ncbi:ABC-2 transporter permease [Staphylococcus shinii]|uniref:ABC-2 transporter permease n=1 Tax=Staphylococcus shinii TaxID=2912228 RepID=UPI0012FE912F|nr:ABC-2 transporter permease [Staphylococcus shinii]
MPGLLLSNLYATKTSIIAYSIIGIIGCIIFSFANPLFSGLLLIISLITPTIDNLKDEKSSNWVKYVSTLPISRDTYIKSQFVFYFLLSLLGSLLSIVIVFIITQNIISSINSGVLGLSLSFQYSLIYPLTFKIGENKSNMIQIISSLSVGILTFLFFYIIIIITPVSSVSVLENLNHQIPFPFVFLFFSVCIIIISYFISVKILKYKDF